MTDDLISRSVAIASAISGRIRTLPTTEDGEDWIRVSEVRESLYAVPSAQPEPCEDAVSREAVLDKAYAYGNGLEPDGFCVDVEDIQALPPVTPKRMSSAEPEPRWIPVTERLPDDGEDVLITFCGEEETRIVPVNYYQKIWFDCIFDIELNPHMVTAWMPLPEPYKGGDESCTT